MPQGKHRDDFMSKGELRGLDIRSDPGLTKEEREWDVKGSAADDWCVVFSEVPVFIRWVLSIPHSEVESYRVVEGDLVAIEAKVPKGHFKLQSTCRKSNSDGDVVSHGSLL